HADLRGRGAIHGARDQERMHPRRAFPVDGAKPLVLRTDAAHPGAGQHAHALGGIGPIGTPLCHAGVFQRPAGADDRKLRKTVEQFAFLAELRLGVEVVDFAGYAGGQACGLDPGQRTEGTASRLQIVPKLCSFGARSSQNRHAGDYDRFHRGRNQAGEGEAAPNWFRSASTTWRTLFISRATSSGMVRLYFSSNAKTMLTPSRESIFSSSKVASGEMDSAGRRCSRAITAITSWVNSSGTHLSSESIIIQRKARFSEPDIGLLCRSWTIAASPAHSVKPPISWKWRGR